MNSAMITQSHMGQEIEEQPSMLMKKSGDWHRQAGQIRNRIEDRPNVLLLGRGSSGNACIFASYLFSLNTGRHPVEFRPWITTQDLPDSIYDDSTALAYSVSGQSTDVSHAAAWLNSRKSQVIGITNAPDENCHLGQASDHLLHLDIGPELAVPATKSLCAQLFATAALCGLEIDEAAGETGRAMKEVIKSPFVDEIAGTLNRARTTAWIARGLAISAALDAALKMQETAGIPSTAWSTAEFLHGPIGSVNSEDAVILFVDTLKPTQSFDAVIKHLVTSGTPFFVIAGMDSSPLPGDLTMRFSMPSPKWAMVPVFSLFSQMIALNIAYRRGLDPDRPSGLQKVTQTI